jgi:hypothetical protein
VAMRMQGVRQMAIVATAIGIALLLTMTVWQRLRAISDVPERFATDDAQPPTVDPDGKPLE